MEESNDKSLPVMTPTLAPAPPAGEDGSAVSQVAAENSGCTDSSHPELDKEREDEDQGQGPIYLSDLSTFITCFICKGYLIDASTITDCLHTFCRSCIIKHFHSSNKCPKCNKRVHLTNPYLKLRLDPQLQNVVYRVVAGLEEKERKQRLDFMKKASQSANTEPVPLSNGSKESGEGESEKDMSLLLESTSANAHIPNFKPLKKKFIRVSGKATIGHIEKFIKKKLDLSPDSQVDIACAGHLLKQSQMLHEVRSTIGDAGMKGPLLVLDYSLVVAPSKEM